MFSEIQVSGLTLTIFPQERWREAILSYLFGLWTNKSEVVYRPKIAFGTIVLRLDQSKGAYYAYGKNQEGEQAPYFNDEEVLIVGPKQEEVEIGLVRFVKNDRIRRITITSDNSGFVRLWKKARRGEYGVMSYNIPISLEECIREDELKAGKT